MPTYEFLNNKTGEVEEHFMSYTKLDEFKENNPHLKQQISSPNIVGGFGDRVKTDGGFKDVLNKIGNAHPGSEVHSRYGTKDIKREKTLEVVKKHAKLQQEKKK
jgi:hypothetical protein